MKLLAPITALIAAASAGRIYPVQISVENFSPSDSFSSLEPQYIQSPARSTLSYPKSVVQSPAYTYDTAYSKPVAPVSVKPAKILGYNFENKVHNYQYAYETENGIKSEEHGSMAKGTAVHGSYSYTGDDGHVYTVTYVADENGFRAQGAHLPTPPPVPEAILKMLEKNAQDESAGIHDDGQYREEETYQHESSGHQRGQSLRQQPTYQHSRQQSDQHSRQQFEQHSRQQLDQQSRQLFDQHSRQQFEQHSRQQFDQHSRQQFDQIARQFDHMSPDHPTLFYALTEGNDLAYRGHR